MREARGRVGPIAAPPHLFLLGEFRTWHLSVRAAMRGSGCRGVVGPVPRPLWMRPGRHAPPGRVKELIQTLARNAYTGPSSRVRARGRFGLTLEPYGSLETIVALSGRHDRFEVVAVRARNSGDRDAVVRRKHGRPRKRSVSHESPH